MTRDDLLPVESLFSFEINLSELPQHKLETLLGDISLSNIQMRGWRWDSPNSCEKRTDLSISHMPGGHWSSPQLENMEYHFSFHGTNNVE